MSHELRTPLTTMLTSMFVIHAHRHEFQPPAREAVELLSEEIERFRRLVVDLLEISRSDADPTLNLEAVPIGVLVQRTADEMAGRPVTTVQEDAVVTVDERRIERVVANLVENAEHHGGGCRAVTVSVEGRDVQIVVDDAGQGVQVDRRERIFERFVTSGGAQSPGTGLGLAIVARHVSAHGGRVHVEDRPGGGARFVVRLPRHRPGP